MSTTIAQLIRDSGWDVTDYNDALWIKSQEKNWDALLEHARLTIQRQEDYESEKAEREYQARFGGDDDDN